MFKTETHIHVSEVSTCSQLSAAEMVRLYHEAGYKTLIISDHFQQRSFDKLGGVSWAEYVDRFVSGYNAAKKAAKQFDMNVIFSAELRLNDACNHYLLYGIDGEFLKKRADLFDMTIKEFYGYAKQNGVTIVQAHPYRDEKCTPTPDYVDGFEVYNSNPRHQNFTKRAVKIAKEHNKPMTAGSDSHRTEDVAITGVITKTEIKTAADYVKALLQGELEIIE